MTLIVMLHVGLIWAAVVWAYRVAARRDGRAPADDIGILWLGVFALYATLPPVSWLLQGSTYGPLSGRLYQLQPSSQDVRYLLSIALAYVVGFVSVYLILLRRVSAPVASAQAPIGASKVAGAIVIVLAAFAVGLVLRMMGVIRPAESYVDSYKVIYDLPVGLRQLLKMVSGFSGVATLVIVVGVLQRWPRYRWAFILYLLSIAVAVNPEGGRGAVVAALLGAVIGWHVLVRPIPSKRLLVGGAFGLLVFLLVGVWRGFGSLTSVGDLGLEGVGVGEFDALWANAVELWQAKQRGGLSVPFGVRFEELFAFVPRQLLWFDKQSLSGWYLDTLHPAYKDIGGGWVFGAISQAVVGGGVFEALIRGAVLGVVAGWIMKWIRTPTSAWWRFPLHLYLLVGVFAGVRDTTFVQWGDVVQTWLPVPIVIAACGSLLTVAQSRHHQLRSG